MLRECHIPEFYKSKVSNDPIEAATVTVTVGSVGLVLLERLDVWPICVAITEYHGLGRLHTREVC